MPDVVRQRDLWLTAAPLSALETAVEAADGSVFLDRALQRHVRFPAVYRAYCRNIGRHGSSADAAHSWVRRTLPHDQLG